MSITGQSYIDGFWQTGAGQSFFGVNPVTQKTIEPGFNSVSIAQLDQALAAARNAEHNFRASTLESRAKFLIACADQIMALGDALTERMCLETGYPKARAEGERARTCGQLRMFADYILSGSYLDARIDPADPERAPIPKPDLRYVNQALGPVVVFGASNFPLAYSVAGGDTASALAAGCPVIVKSHPSHPGTSELVAQAIVKAIELTGMPPGIFNLVNGVEHAVGAHLVTAPEVKAVGFTGSLKGGMALFNLANSRSEPIPVFAEMGSINPVFFLPEKLSNEAGSLAKQFVGSLTLGTGQFCVNPGLVVAQKGASLDQFINAMSSELEAVPAGVMLNQGVCASYEQGAESLNGIAGVELIQSGQAKTDDQGLFAQTKLFTTSAKTFLNEPLLQEELFGPAALVVVCDDAEQMNAVAKSLNGQLTGTIHGSDEELQNHQQLVHILSTKVGRVVISGFPTGVEVVPSMMHGGPFPASTDARFTSVGTAAIQRFVRPVCYQNFPNVLLPLALQDANPLNIPRTVNGHLIPSHA